MDNSRNNGKKLGNVMNSNNPTVTQKPSLYLSNCNFTHYITKLIFYLGRRADLKRLVFSIRGEKSVNNEVIM